MPSAFTMTILQTYIDHIPRMKSSVDYKRLRVAIKASKAREQRNRGGNAVAAENDRYSARHAENHISVGNINRLPPWAGAVFVLAYSL